MNKLQELSDEFVFKIKEKFDEIQFLMNDMN
jgi:hypothetical protein